MALRPYWKGYLKLSLVTCPVTLTAATTEGEKLRFHTLNRETGHPIKSRYVDAETGKPVREGDEVKGYETADGKHIIIEDEELEAVGLESTRTIDIGQFVPAASIEWLWYDQPYYLVPDDEVAEEAFSVIREAMTVTDTVGISRLVLSRRERAVMLQPRGKGIVLWTLRYGDEVRNPEEVFEKIGKTKPDAKLVKMVEKLIDEQVQPWTEKMVGDPVQDQLKQIIEAKRKRGTKKPAKAAAAPSENRPTGDNIIDIMSALKQSLEEKPKRKRT